ncbi:MAG: molybdopterin-dependent oxidoreductase [Bacteriovoracaceae bacterium]|jgi:DMSO/TMAO reductase YedYZ molybdopterin-dependent catalytic subunit|nr:molybdopterin-dependent oxidoreductase [Bacteriovoracaceae bacterium]
MKKNKKLSRRLVMKLAGLTGLSVLVGRNFIDFHASRKIASSIPTFFKGEKFSFASLAKIKEYKISARIVTKLANLKSKIKYDKGHNTRMYSALEEYVPIGKTSTSDWLIDNNIPNILNENTENFYIRTEKPNQLNHSIDEIVLEGTTQSSKLLISSIIDKQKPIGSVMMECAGNDRYAGFRLMSVANWDGVTVEELFREDKEGNSFFGLAKIHPNATHVVIEGFDESTNTKWNRLFGVESTPGASWIFSIEELKKQKAFFATKMNSQELTEDHGYPVRLVVPGYYGCASIKWVNRIKFFKPHTNLATEDQMQEFSDRTGQDGVPKLFKDHKPPHIHLSSTLVAAEKWQSDSGKVRYKLNGLIWGGIHHENPRLKITLRKRGSKRIVLSKEVTLGPRNPLSFQHWEVWWDEPLRGNFLVDIECLDEDIFTPRLDAHHYRRIVKIS